MKYVPLLLILCAIQQVCANPTEFSLVGLRPGMAKSELLAQHRLVCSLHPTEDPSEQCDGITSFGGRTGNLKVMIKADRVSTIHVSLKNSDYAVAYDETKAALETKYGPADTCADAGHNEVCFWRMSGLVYILTRYTDLKETEISLGHHTEAKSIDDDI